MENTISDINICLLSLNFSVIGRLLLLIDRQLVQFLKDTLFLILIGLKSLVWGMLEENCYSSRAL